MIKDAQGQRGFRCDGRSRRAVRSGGASLQPRLRRRHRPVRRGARGVARFRHGASGEGVVVRLANDPAMLGQARTLVRDRRRPDDERAGTGALRRAGAAVQGRAQRGGFGAGPASDAVPVRSGGASGRDAARRLPWTLSVGAGPHGAGVAVLVEGPARLRDHARLPRLRAGRSRRLRPRRGRIACGGRTRTAQFLAASHRRTCDGNDRAPGRRSGLDDRA